MTALALQFGGSLAAVLALAWLAGKLRLGGDPRLLDPDEARRLGDEAVCGFDAEDVALDRAGMSALLRDRENRVMLIRRHGARWVARLLDGHAAVRIDGDIVEIVTGERSFGTITLDLGDQAQAWAGSLRRDK